MSRPIKCFESVSDEAINAKRAFYVASSWPILTFFARNKLLRRRRRTKRKFSSEKVSGKAERPSEKFDGEKGMEGLGEVQRLVTLGLDSDYPLLPVTDSFVWEGLKSANNLLVEQRRI